MHLDRLELELPPRYRAMLQDILRQHLPLLEVWVYGSRVTGGCHAGSDIDLVVRNPEKLDRPVPKLYRVRSAFSESNLPLKVDLHDWAGLPAAWRENIEAAHVVVQSPWREDDTKMTKA